VEFHPNVRGSAFAHRGLSVRVREARRADKTHAPQV
jgi:hypothetical protein